MRRGEELHHLVEARKDTSDAVGATTPVRIHRLALRLRFVRIASFVSAELFGRTDYTAMGCAVPPILAGDLTGGASTTGVT